MAVLGLAASSYACSDPAPANPDANTRPDAAVPVVDAGPKLYQEFTDFPREACDDTDSLATFSFLGKWQNTPDDASAVFDSYFLMENGLLKGILDLIPADVVTVDDNNLFLHRNYNSTSLAINLCALVDADTLRGYMAKCNGMVCTVGTLSATLVDPVTQQ
jgi:hypothetical protein